MSRRPGWLTRSEYARHRGVTRQAVAKALREGRIVAEQGLINRDAADEMWAANSGPESDSQRGSGYSRYREVWQQYRALREQLRYREDAEKVLDAEDARLAVFELGRRLQELLLAAGPRIRTQLAAARTPRECERIVTAEMRRIAGEFGKLSIEAAEKQAG